MARHDLIDPIVPAHCHGEAHPVLANLTFIHGFLGTQHIIERGHPETPGAQRNAEILELPEGADPIAASILNSGDTLSSSYMDTFTKYCCVNLPNQDIPNIELGKPRFFPLTQEALPYRFNEGDSRYIIIRLPSDSSANYPLRLRSFIRGHKKWGIEHGVFFPQLVTLDKDKKPLRIFSAVLPSAAE